ncbi:hypothetical protein ACTXT7_011892 [Hymenolepis weldensis]
MHRRVNRISIPNVDQKTSVEIKLIRGTAESPTNMAQAHRVHALSRIYAIASHFYHCDRSAIVLTCSHQLHEVTFTTQFSLHHTRFSGDESDKAVISYKRARRRLIILLDQTEAHACMPIEPVRKPNWEFSAFIGQIMQPSH